MGDGGACHHQMGWAGEVCLGRVGKSIVQFGLVKSSMLTGYQSGQIDMNLDLGKEEELQTQIRKLLSRVFKVMN